MQSYDDLGKIVNASAGPLDEMKRLAVEEIERDKVAKVVLAKLPTAGQLLEVNGLIYEVKFVSPGRGKVHLQLKGFVRESIENIQIIVNGQPAEIQDSQYASYENILALAKENGFQGSDNPTMTYAKGPKHNRSGIMGPGTTLLLVNGMVFNLADTGAA